MNDKLRNLVSLLKDADRQVKKWQAEIDATPNGGIERADEQALLDDIEQNVSEALWVAEHELYRVNVRRQV